MFRMADNGAAIEVSEVCFAYGGQEVLHNVSFRIGARALVAVDFRGCAIADHVPAMVGGRNVGWAYCIAYMKSYLERAEAELGKKRT